MDHEEQFDAESEEYLRSCIESSVGSICEIDWKHEFHKSQIEVNSLRSEVNDLATLNEMKKGQLYAADETILWLRHCLVAAIFGCAGLLLLMWLRS